MSASGARPKNFSTCRRTNGTRVEPPTSTTPSMSFCVICASSSTWRQARMVRWISGSIIASNALRVMGWAISRPPSSARRVAWSAPVSASLAARAASSKEVAPT